MKKATMLWLIAAVSLILVGGTIFVCAMAALQWDFKGLSTTNYETNSYEIDEPFAAITVNTDTADVIFLPAEDGKRLVVCHEQEDRRHTVTVQDGVLVVAPASEGALHGYIGIHFDTPRITLYLPAGEYDTLRITSDTGDVHIPGDFTFKSIEVENDTGEVTSLASAAEFIKITADTGDLRVENIATGALTLCTTTGDITAVSVTCHGDLSVDVTTGDVTLTGVSCKSLRSSGDTGDITLGSVIAAEALAVERSTGEIRLAGCDAATLSLQTDTGDIEGTLLSEKVFDVSTDTGDKEIPSTQTGGRCEITSDTGDIKIRIQQ